MIYHIIINCYIIGTLPKELWNIKNMARLHLSINRFNGTIDFPLYVYIIII